MEYPLIYVINLRRNPERKLFIQRQLDALNLNYQLVDAIDKYDLKSPKYRSKIALALGISKSNLEYKYNIMDRHSKASRQYNGEGLGRLACLLSHVKAYNLILDANNDPACILEDDASILPTWPLVLAESSSLSWDILMFSTQSRAVRKILDQSNGLYKSIIKSHNYIVLTKRCDKKIPEMYRRITKLLDLSHHQFPNQSKQVMRILEEFYGQYKYMATLYNPKRRLVWLLSSNTPELMSYYKTLKEYVACRLGAAPLKHSRQSVGYDHCIVEPAEMPSSAMGYMLKKSATRQCRQIAIDKNILGIDSIPWYLYADKNVRLRFISPPCITASYIYLKYSAHHR